MFDAFFRWFLPAFAIALTFSAPAPAVAQPALPQDYTLAPSDTIQLRAVMWNNTTLAFEGFDAISGTYRVGPGGRVMLPIIGAMSAAGMSADALAGRVADELQTRIGASEAPSVAIEIASYGPVFVMGEVAQPGEYSFRPGMRAMQLVALAGGYYRLSDIDGGRLQLDVLRMSGNLLELELDLANAAIRRARLEAEVEDAGDFAVPAGISHPEGPAALRTIYERERQIFQANRESYARDIASLQATRALLERELQGVNQKLEGITRQVAMMSEAVGNLESLLDRGLARSPTLLTSQRALFELESRELDAENQAFRAGQSLEETERDLNEVRQRRQRDTLAALQAINAEISQLESRRKTQRALLETTGQEVALLRSEEEAEVIPVFRIAREVDGTFVTTAVSPDARLRPLDTLEVSWIRADEPQSN